MIKAVSANSLNQPSNPMDWLGKIVTFKYTDPMLKPHYPEQTARVVSVVVHESEPVELGLMIANLDFHALSELEIISIET